MSIEISNNGLLIKDLIITDPETVGFYNSIDTDEVRLDSLKLAIKLGTTMVERANVSSQMDFVEKRMAEVMSHSESQAKDITDATALLIQKSFDPEEADSAITAVKGVIESTLDPMRLAANYIKEQQKFLDTSFDPANGDGYSGKMVKTFSDMENKFQEMFNPDSKTSFPSWIENSLGDNLSKSLTEQVGNMQSIIRKELTDIKEDLAKAQSAKEAVDELTEKTPIKGVNFEGEVQLRLELVAKNTGDIVTNTTNDIGIVSASKKGDFNYDINGLEDQRIVIETKNTPMLSCPVVFKSMEKTMQNRSASFGIYITNTEEQLQKQIGTWQVFTEKNLIVTHSDMLEPSIKVAKMLMSITNESVDGVDTGELEKQLVLITDAIKKTQAVKSKLTNIEDSVTFLRNLEFERNKAVEGAISNIREVISKATAIAA